MSKNLKMELGELDLKLFEELPNNVRANFDDRSTILLNQDIDIVKSLLYKNYMKVSTYYHEKSIGSIENHDINYISVLIVLHYLYIYNSWKNNYVKETNRDLLFLDEDFENPSTYDIIIDFFKKTDQKNWRTKSMILMGMNSVEFEKFYNEREKFYNK